MDSIFGTPTVEDVLRRLAAGAVRHSARNSRERARLAAATARTVAAAADEWAELGVAIESALPGGAEARETPSQARIAEEIATGPLTTLRLLLLLERSLDAIDRRGVPEIGLPRIVHHATGDGRAARIEVPALPARGLYDPLIFGGFSGVVRCGNPGSLERFHALRLEEATTRPAGGGVAVVLGAGNVTGLAPADALCQIFEHGRSAFVKLHPVHERLAGTFTRAFAPLVEADLLAFTAGGAEVASHAIASSHVTNIHLTGGRAAFDAVVRLTSKPMTCELGNVTPWIVMPGDYSAKELAFQADAVAASIINNASFNCIATKLVVTSRSWRQREAFVDRVGMRLAAELPRIAWYPGAVAAWETLAGTAAPSDGTLPWLFRRDLDRRAERHWIDREWFIPACAETALDADDVEGFCKEASGLAASLPGSLGASVTLPSRGDPRDLRRAEGLVEHLGYGVVAVNCWSALAYSMANVPWGGFPGATLDQPQSGIGFVHDPLFLPLVHNSIVRGPLCAKPLPAWFPWHPRAGSLARELVRLYAGGGLLSILRMLPNLRWQDPSQASGRFSDS